MLQKNLRSAISVSLLSMLIILSCESNKDTDIPHPVSLENLTGVIQKGPFLNGTSISVAELNEDLFQTGKNFTAQTMDNRGSFQLMNIALSTQFAELKADGFYYNEVLAAASSARLILYALSDLTIKLSGGLWFYNVMPDGPVNWKVSRYDDQMRTQTFKSIEPGTKCDLKILFAADTASQPDTIQTTPIGNTVFVEYFENLSDTATRSKWITLE